MSSVSKKFVLDANVFIEAHRNYYAFDIAPGFWDKLLSYCQHFLIISIEQVLKDLEKGHDPNDPKKPDLLCKWATTKFKPYFKNTDQEVADAYEEIINWAQQNNSYNDAAKQDFADVSDSWLIAYAKAKDLCVVTHEKHSDKTKRVKIPTVCKEFEIECINTFEMMRRIGLKLE